MQVGFISNLPHDLVSAFRSTLEEVVNADVLVHVRDSSNPHADNQRRDVLQVLSDLGTSKKLIDSMIEVMNKADKRPEGIPRLSVEHPERLWVSATEGLNIAHLMGRIEAAVIRNVGLTPIEVRVPNDDAPLMSWLYSHGAIARKNEAATATQNYTVLTAVLDEATYKQFSALFPKAPARLVNQMQRA
jgi:GTPase